MQNAMIALIPAYEPTSELISLTKALSEGGFTVVVVNDGSGLEYQSIFQQTEAYATVLSYGENRGKGHALKTGFSYVVNRYGSDSVVVTLDSDGQHTVVDATRVAQRTAEHPDALTLGVRSFGAGTPLRSRFGNSVTRGVYRISTGNWVRDTQTGLRGCAVSLLPVLLEVPGERFEYEMNVLMVCPKRGIPLQEVLIKTIYRNGNKGSHFRAVEDSARIYGNILKFAASSLIGFVVDYGLYSLLVVALSGLGTVISIPLSNVLARMVSATTNFMINKRLVFQHQGNILKTGAEYFSLAACILCGNTVLLSVLVNNLGMNKFAAKLVTELTFFALSWLVQRFFIFRKRDSYGEKHADSDKTHRIQMIVPKPRKNE